MMDEVTLYRPSPKTRIRVEELEPGCYAVVERSSGKIVSADFETYTAAWVWAANNCLDSPNDNR